MHWNWCSGDKAGSKLGEQHASTVSQELISWRKGGLLLLKSNFSHPIWKQGEKAPLCVTPCLLWHRGQHEQQQ